MITTQHAEYIEGGWFVTALYVDASGTRLASYIVGLPETATVTELEPYIILLLTG